MEQETNRQKKIGKLLQQDLTDIIQQELRKNARSHIIVSVSKVRVTTDLSIAKAYLSIFPDEKAETVMNNLQQHQSHLKHLLAQRTRHQLRKMPELNLYIDDSLEYKQGIDEALKGHKDPIKNPDLLDKRKKL